jgi:hypothetical protein
MPRSSAFTPTEVVARFDLEGQITPQQFTWRNRTMMVVEIGRRWIDEDGTHALVMAPGEQIYELLFAPEELRWYLKAHQQSWT